MPFFVPTIINGFPITMTRGGDVKVVTFAIGSLRTRITGFLVATQGALMSDGYIATASVFTLRTLVEGRPVIAVGSPFVDSDGWAGVVPLGNGPAGKTVLLG